MTLVHDHHQAKIPAASPVIDLKAQCLVIQEILRELVQEAAHSAQWATFKAYSKPLPDKLQYLVTRWGLDINHISIPELFSLRKLDQSFQEKGMVTLDGLVTVGT